MNKKKIAIIIGCMFFILVFAIVLQIRTINNTNSIGIQSSTSNSKLKDDLLRWMEKYEAVNSSAEKEEERLKSIREQAVQNNPNLIQQENDLKKNNMSLGLANVKGQGVIITLKDNNKANSGNIGIAEDIRSYLVHDANLREIIRKLKNSGAEAISVNDERIVNNTAVVCSGNVIRINDKKIGSPFVIKAIGSQELLYGNLKDTIEKLNDSGIIVEIEKKEEIEIDKYNGAVKFNYAEIIE